MPTVKQLVAFKTTADFLNMTKAAKDLSITQPSLSQLISDLEKDAGHKLFNRSSGGGRLELNEYGKIYYRHTLNILHELTEITREVEQLDTKKNNTISFITNCASYLPGLMGLLRKTLVKPNFIQELGTTSSISKKMIESAYDYSIIALAANNDINKQDDVDYSRLKYQIVLIEYGAIVYPEGHWLSSHKEIRLKELREECFIGLLDSSGLFESTLRFYNNANFVPEYKIKTDDVFGLLHCVKAGLGIAHIPLSLALRDDYCKNHMCIINKPLTPVEIALCYNTNIANSYQHNIIKETCKKYFGQLSETNLEAISKISR